MLRGDAFSPSVSEVLKKDGITVEDVLSCSDVIPAYRNQDKELIQFLSMSKSINGMVKLIHSTDKPHLTRKAIDLFTSTNKTLLRLFSQKRKTTEFLISVLNTPVDAPKVHDSVITAIMQVCLYSFNDWEREMFAIFNSSQTIFPSLLKNVEKPAIFSFLRSILSNSSQAQTFLWYFFAALMDEHGVGMDTPDFIQAEFALRVPNVHLLPEQRKNVIDLLSLFFHVNVDNAYKEFLAAVTQGLPLILQDCNTDAERASVFRLGLFLPVNPTVSLSAVSVLECFRLPCDLIIAALRYLNQAHYKISPDLAELFLFRLIRAGSNINVIRESLQLFREFSDSQMMQNTLIGIMNYCYDKLDWKTSIKLRSARMMLTYAINGEIVDPMSANFHDLLAKFMKNTPEGYVDQNRLKMLKGKSSQAMPTHYNASILWGSEATKMMDIYPSISKPSYLRALNPRKFEDVHFVYETKNELYQKLSNSMLYTKEQSPKNTSTLVTYGYIDEFDDGEPIENPFLVPPPPQTICTPKKPSLILSNILAPHATLHISSVHCLEVPLLERKNRKTQTKTPAKVDCAIDAGTGECIVTPHEVPQKPQLIPPHTARSMSATLKPLSQVSPPPSMKIVSPLKKDPNAPVTQIQAPSLDLPIPVPTPSHQLSSTSNLLLTVSRNKVKRRVSSESKKPVTLWFEQSPPIVEGLSSGPNPFQQVIDENQEPKPPSESVIPASLISPPSIIFKVEKKKPNPYLEIVMPIIKSEMPSTPPFSTAGLNLDWIINEMESRKKSRLPQVSLG